MVTSTVTRRVETIAPDGLLDTSVVIELETRDPGSLPIFPGISAVTLAELSAGPLTTNDPVERASRQARLQAAEATFEPIPFDASAARSFSFIAAAHRQSGRKTAARAFDALIAATALSRGIPVYTMNPADFANIAGLEVRVPRAADTDPA